jgi:methylmalonyl-CoA/ethylmalonyl-CoA epimerase
LTRRRILKPTFKLDHIGIAVESLAQGKPFYEGLGLGSIQVEEVPGEKVKVGMFELENDSRIELLEPTAADSAVAKFLSNRGPGIHHICLRVNDVRGLLRTLKAQGVKLVNESPVQGAHNCLIAFIHPKSTGGILIELSEKQEAKK